MNKKKVKISHWKIQLDTTKDTLIRINIQKTKQTKNIRGGGTKVPPLGVGIGEIKIHSKRSIGGTLVDLPIFLDN